MLDLLIKNARYAVTSNAKDDYQIKVMGDKATIIINTNN